MNYLSTRIGPITVSIIVSVTFGIVLYVVLTHVGIPESQMVILMIGILSAKFGDVVNYWIGSSSGSKAKDETIAQNNQLANSIALDKK